MLKSGFHDSFTELFSLIEKRKNEKLNAGVDSILWHVSGFVIDLVVSSFHAQPFWLKDAVFERNTLHSEFIDNKSITY